MVFVGIRRDTSGFVGIRWYLMVFVGIRYHSMVFGYDCRDSLGFVGSFRIVGIFLYFLVFDGI